MKKLFIKKSFIYYLIAFVMPVIFFAIVSLYLKIFPFGSSSFRTVDAVSQYPSMLMELKNLGGFYSLNAGLGYNFYSTMAYYLLSPINLIVFFFKNIDINIIMTIIVYIKLGLASLTMAFYFKQKYATDKIYSLALATAYALMGYSASYYFNIMWMDAVYMLPLVLYGIEQLVYQGKNKKLYLFLILTIIFNYYIGYMVCIFSVLYFIFILVNYQTKDKRKIIKNFIVTCLLAGLTCAFIIIPTIYSLMNGKGELFNNVNYLTLNKSILYFFYNLFPGSTFAQDIEYSGLFVYSSMLALSLFIMAFFNSGYSRKFKLSLIIFILIFILSFSTNLINYPWHLFQAPIFYLNRFSFCFSALIIIVARDCYHKRATINLSWLKQVIIIIITAGLVIGSYLLKIHLVVKNMNYIAFSLVIYSSYIFFYKNRQFRPAIISFLIIELILNTSVALTANKNDFLISEQKVIKTANSAITAIKKDESVYRIDYTDQLQFNSGMFYNFNSYNFFSSLYNHNFINIATIVNDKEYLNPIVNLAKYDPYMLQFLGIKYLVLNDQISLYPKLFTQDNLNVYQITNTATYGYAANPKINQLKFSNNYYDNITKIISQITNVKTDLYLDWDYEIKTDNCQYEKKDNQFVKINKKKKATITISFTVHQDSLISPLDANSLINLNGQYVDNKGDDHDYQDVIQMTINGKKINDITYNRQLFEDDKVKLRYQLIDDSLEMRAGEFKLIANEQLTKVTNQLMANSLIMEKINKNIIQGHIKIKNDATMILTIPYEKGFTIKVDGKKTEYYRVLNSLVGFDLKAGSHQIEVKFYPRGLNLGIIISSISLITFVVISITQTKKRTNKNY